MTFAKTLIGRIPRFNGTAAMIALGAIVGVPLVTAFFPRWGARVALPLFAITSIGIALTVPDVERVSVVMGLLVVAAIVGVVAKLDPEPPVLAAIAFVTIGTAVLDSGGRAAAIARATGCFGVLLAAPVAGWCNELRTKEFERRPPIAVVVIAHCLVVGWSSRVLIRESPMSSVILALAGALLIATLLLFATARRVTVPS